jgi:hypothetical protein
MCLLKDFLHLETVGGKVGLELNWSKFEVIGHHRDGLCSHHTALICPRPLHQLFFWTSIQCWKGSVLSCSYHSDWNSCCPMTVCTYYTQHTHSNTHYAYLFRTAPCTNSPELPLYDGVLRESLIPNQYIDLDDHRWSQALLPVRWSGLGICWWQPGSSFLVLFRISVFFSSGSLSVLIVVSLGVPV